MGRVRVREREEQETRYSSPERQSYKEGRDQKWLNYIGKSSPTSQPGEFKTGAGYTRQKGSVTGRDCGMRTWWPDLLWYVK